MTSFEACNIEPFVADVTAQVNSLENAGQAAEILSQQVEAYLQRLKAAICADLQFIEENCCNGGSGGVTTFLELTDVLEASYAGEAGNVVTVNGGETGLVFTTPSAGGGLPDLTDNTEVSSGRTFNGNDTFFKLVNIGTLPNTTSKSVAHNIASTFILVQAYGVGNDTGANVAVPIIFSTHSSLGNTIWFNTTSTNVVVTTGNDRTNFTSCWVVLEYYYP